MAIHTPTVITDLTARNADLPDLVNLLRDQHSRRRDLVKNAGDIRAEGGNLVIQGVGEPILSLDGVTSQPGTFTPTEVCDEGIAAKLGVPAAYLRKLRAEHVDLYDANVNGWLERDRRSFMVRCLSAADGGTGVARAFLSDRYSIIDNFDILVAALDGARAAGVDIAVEPGGCDLTERRMYLKLRSEAVRVLAPALLSGYRSPFTGLSGADNPVVWAGLVIKNSEVGAGAFTITPRMVVQICDNGLEMPVDARKAVHLGGRQEQGQIQWSEETQRRQLAVITSKTTDAVREFISADYCERALREIEKDAGKPVTDPKQTITVISKQLKFSEQQADSILAHFYKGGAETAGGILHAVTSVAQTMPHAEDAYAMESQAIAAMRLAARL